MKNILFLSIVTLLSACTDQRECSFSTLENAVDCACKLSNEKEEANSDKDILDKLKNQSKLLNEEFDQAIKDGVFTEAEFIQQLKLNCESF